jgi:hypothetical protein
MSCEKLFSLFITRSLIMYMSAIGRLWIVVYQLPLLLLLLFLQQRIIQQMFLSQLQYGSCLTVCNGVR